MELGGACRKERETKNGGVDDAGELQCRRWTGDDRTGQNDCKGVSVEEEQLVVQ